MQIAAAQIFSADFLTRCRFDQRRPSKKDRPLIADNDRFIGHGRHISAAGGATAHYARNLRNALGRHIGLIEENPAKMLSIRENFGLIRQVCAATINQIDARQMVLFGNCLRAQMLLHRHGVIGAAFDCRIIADNHALTARYHANACNQACSGDIFVINAGRRQLADF